MKQRAFGSDAIRFLVMAMLPFLVDCSGVGFQANSDIPTGPDHPLYCQPPLEQITTPVKIAILMDASGSGQQTDPNKVMRLESLRSFFSQYANKTNFSWNLTVFQGDGAEALVNTGDMAHPAFSNSTAEMEAAITQFAAIPDQGQTPYHAALTMILNLIANDTGARANTKYIVVLLSDGMPTDYVAGALTVDQQADQDVQNLVSARPGQTTLSTIFYGTSDPTAGPRLAGMAATGGGQFLNASSSVSMNINDVVTVQGLCQ